MIIVVGSCHDSVATNLVTSWPDAALCSAEDFVRQGWVWRHGQPQSRTWIVSAKPVRDADVAGVFIRRSTVYAEELTTTHPSDRAFQASEIHAFLTFVLATTSARVVNPVFDGTFGEEALRPERWTAAASELGISVHPLRVTSRQRRRPRFRTYEVEVVGGEAFGDAPARVREGARKLAGALGLDWGVFLFDARYRLITISGARRPSDAAAAALASLLNARRS